LPATIRPWQTATLAARVSGYLRAWHRDLGAVVKAGDLLAEIDTPELDQELASAEALVHEASAAAVQARAERREAGAALNVAESALARVRAELELVKSQLTRREKLLAQRVITEEEYDTFFRQSQARQAEFAAAESEIGRLRSNLDTRDAIIGARDAAVKSRQSEVNRLQELQGFKRIVAPFAGTITRRTAEVGQLITAGKEPLFNLEDMSRVRVQINVPQTYAANSVPGVAARVSLPESNVAAVDAKITRSADSVDPGTRTMLVEIELANAADQFQPGSYAQVTLTAPQSGAEWTVPTNTLAMHASGPHVAVISDKNQIELRPVTLGRDFGRRIAITSGLRGGEQLVVNPTDDLTPGTRVRTSDRDKQPGDSL